MPGYELWNDQEKKEVMDVLESGILMRYNFDSLRKGHWKTKSLEESLSKKLNIQYVHTCSSGTSALISALSALGVGYGDEVIIPTFTFVASFEAVLSVGAIPILTNVNESLTLDLNAIEANITPRTKLIMPVHMCGSMADMDGIINIAKKHNLLILEDACQAMGGTYKGKYLGGIGDAGSLSFDFVKTITCGEGGAILTNNKQVYEKVHPFTDHGHDHIGNDRGAEQHPFWGYNFRMNELNAAVGYAQLEKLDTILSIQKNNHDILFDILNKIEGLKFRTIFDEEGNTKAFLSILLPTENQAREVNIKLKEASIDACFYWFDNNWHYIKKWDHLKNMKTLSSISPEIISRFQSHLNQYNLSPSDNVMGRTISFLIKLSWTKEEIERRGHKMADIIKQVL